MSEPRIVLFDLETIPDVNAAFDVFPGLSDWPGKTMRADINSIICFGYRVFGEKKSKCINAWDFSSTWNKNINDDRKLLQAIYPILKSADAVSTHNGAAFDWKFLQTRLEIWKMPTLPPIPNIDTKQLAKRNLFLTSNSLKRVTEVLTNLRKIDNGGWELWKRVRNKEPKALKEMSTYCIGDVDALEADFRVLRKYAKNIPNHNLFSVAQGMKVVCPTCGSTRLHSEGIRATQTSTYRRLICQDCNAAIKQTINEKNTRV